MLFLRDKRMTITHHSVILRCRFSYRLQMQQMVEVLFDRPSQTVNCTVQLPSVRLTALQFNIYSRCTNSYKTYSQVCGSDSGVRKFKTPTPNTYCVEHVCLLAISLYSMRDFNEIKLATKWHDERTRLK